jgi:hypothetical protein
MRSTTGTPPHPVCRADPSEPDSLNHASPVVIAALTTSALVSVRTSPQTGTSGQCLRRTRWHHSSISQNPMVRYPAHPAARANPPIPLNRSRCVGLSSLIVSNSFALRNRHGTESIPRLSPPELFREIFFVVCRFGSRPLLHQRSRIGHIGKRFARVDPLGPSRMNDEYLDP